MGVYRRGAGFTPSSSLFTVVNASYGEAVDYDNIRTGRELSVSPRVEFKLGKGLSTELGHTFVRFTVEADELYVDDVDEQSTHLSSQVLLSYKINPQTVFFLGYSDNHRGDQDVDLTQSGRTVFAKIGYAWVL